MQSLGFMNLDGSVKNGIEDKSFQNKKEKHS